MGAGASIGNHHGEDDVTSSDFLGIRLSHVEKLLQTQGGRPVLQTLSCHELYLQSIQPMLSSTPQVSYVSLLRSQTDFVDAVGVATHYLVYSPQQSFLAVIDSLLQQYQTQLDDVILWMDIFSLPLSKFTHLKMTTEMLNSSVLTQSILCVPHWKTLGSSGSSTGDGSSIGGSNGDSNSNGAPPLQQTSTTGSSSYSLAILCIQLYLNLQQSHQVDICMSSEAMQDLMAAMRTKGFYQDLQDDVLLHLSVQRQLEDNSEEVLAEALPILQKIDASVGISQCDDLLRKIVTLALVNLLLPHPWSQVHPSDVSLPPPKPVPETQASISPRAPDSSPEDVEHEKKLYFQENLAHLLLSIGQTEHAKDLFQHYLHIQQSKKLHDSKEYVIEIIQSMQQLADVYLMLQDFASAKTLYDEALNMISSNYTTTSPEYIHFSQHIATIYLQHEIVHEGLKYAEDAWKQSIAFVGYWDDLSLESLKLLLDYYITKDDNKTMHSLYQDVYAKFNTTSTESSKEHIEMKLKYLNLFGMFAFQSQDLIMAKELSEHCLQLTLQEYGTAHVNTWNAMNNLMNLLTNMEDFDAAERIAEDIVASKTAALGSKVASTLSARITLVNFYMIRGKYDLAKVLLVELSKDCKEVFGEDHPETVDVKKQLVDLQAMEAKQ